MRRTWANTKSAFGLSLFCTMLAVSSQQVAATQSATHTGLTGYYAGETNTISCTFSYTATNTLLSLLWTPSLPAGWDLVATSGDGDPEIQSGEILFVGSLTNNPIQFVYEVYVPATHTQQVAITANAEYQLDTMINPVSTNATPVSLGFARVQRLEIISAYGSPNPAVGIHTNLYRSTLTNSVATPTAGVGGVREANIGFTGTGSAPAAGTTNIVIISALTNDTKITWLWTNQFNLAIAANVNGSVNSGSINGWYTDGAQVTNLLATPANGFHFVNWTGTVTSTSNPLTVTMSQAYTLYANFSGNQADLEVFKAVTGGQNVGGQDLIYTISVTNSGPQAATNVVVTDTLPPGVTTSDSLTRNLGTLLPNTVTSYLFTVSIDSDTLGSITNRATVSTDTTDPNMSNNVKDAAATITGDADLSITTVATGGSGIAGQTLIYTISVSNAGPSDALNVIAVDTPPTGVTALGSLTNVIGTLSVGASTSYTFTVSIHQDTLGAISNVVNVSSSTGDSSPGNNTDNDVSVVTAVADLGITKTATGGSGIAGETLIYTITVTNNGPSRAQGVIAVDTLPPGVTTSDAITNNIGALSAGGTTSYLFTVSINANTTGSISNSVTVSSSTTDSTPGNNTDFDFTAVSTSADLAVRASVTGGSGVAGEQIIYTITVSNAGPSRAQSVFTLDTPPSGVVALDPVTNFIGVLNVGNTTSRTFTVSINTDTLGGITNTVTVSSTTPDAVTSNNTALVASTVTASADLGLTKTVTGGSNVAGTSMQYTIAVTNAGPSLARNVIVTDTVGSFLTAQSPTTTNIGNIAVGAVVSFTFDALIGATAEGNVTNAASVVSAATDPGPLSSNATAITAVTNVVNVGVTKVISNATAYAGSQLMYIITYSNTGPSAAKSVVVTETPGANLTALDSTVWNIGTVAPGVISSMTFRVTANAAASGNVTNALSISTTSSDSDASNNNFARVTTLTTEADLSITKSGPTSSTAGSNVTYTIVVSNAGPSLARNVVVTDTPPAGTTPIDVTVTNIGNLAVGLSTSLTFRLFVPVSMAGVITNLASVTNSVTDPGPGNDSDVALVTIGTGSLTIVATAGPGGSITPSGSISVLYGANTNFLIQAMALYDITDVRVNGSTVGTFGPGSNTFVQTFSNVTTNHTITASFGIEPNLLTARHSAAGYAESQTNTISCTISNLSGVVPTTLIWAPVLPAGWQLISTTGAGSPVVTNATDILLTSLTATNAINFTIDVSVPFGSRGSNELSGVLIYGLTGMVSNEVTAIASKWLHAYHSIDFDAVFGFIDGTEAARILTYWNSGSVHRNASGRDGYAIGAGATNDLPHPADYRAPFWSIDGSEANRVLAYWRAGGYHVNITGFDGFAAGSATFFVGKQGKTAEFLGVLSAVLAKTGPTLTFDPGETVSFSTQMAYEGDVLGLFWRPQIPQGWSVVSIHADGQPQVRQGEALWVGRLPLSPVNITCTLKAPINATPRVELRGIGEAYFRGLYNPVTTAPEQDSMVFTATDSDADGMADAWESHYGGNPTALSPDADTDGDGSSNLAESLAGTDPTDAGSRLRIRDMASAGVTGLAISWDSVAERNYLLSLATNLASPFVNVAGPLPATPPTNTFRGASGEAEALYYRIQLDSSHP